MGNAKVTMPTLCRRAPDEQASDGSDHVKDQKESSSSLIRQSSKEVLPRKTAPACHQGPVGITPQTGIS